MAWLEPVISKIDELLESGRPTIHEVGCGSTVNLRILKQIYGDKIVLSGSDIFPVRTSEFPISRWDFSDPSQNRYDLVFSVTALCLAKDERAAFLNVVSMASKYAVLVEPLRSLALPHQAAYLDRAGHRCSFDELAISEGMITQVAKPSLPFSIKHPSGSVTIKR
jgi:hypothetical protein